MSVRPFFKNNFTAVMAYGLAITFIGCFTTILVMTHVSPEEKQAYYNKCIKEVAVDIPITPEMMRECRENTSYFFDHRR